MLIGAVVIHGPDFFVAAAAADKSDLRRGDSGNASGKPRDDLVGELMREAPGLLFGRVAMIHAADHGGAEVFFTS